MANLKTILQKKQKRFSKMNISEKRIAIAKDVIAKVKTEQFRAMKEHFVSVNGQPIYTEMSNETQICDLVNSNQKCTVCAKGGLFMSYIGYVDNFKIGDMSYNAREQVSLENNEMNSLSRIFSRKQLSLIESTFEGGTFAWNTPLSRHEEDKCFSFHNKFDSASERLIGICRNIIKNKGTFKP